MADALYHPTKGYYTAHIKSVGRRGDFSTSATLHPALGTAVKAWLNAEAIRNPSVRDVIEVGPGDGSLMAEVRRRDRWFQRRPFRYHLVESSPILRAVQIRRFGRNVAHHADIHAALDAARGRAFVFSNELVDAFPATLIQWDAPASAWREIHIAKGNPPVELTRPFEIPDALRASSSALAAWNRENPPPHPHQRIEIHFSYLGWLRSWAAQLAAGAVLTIDYGGNFPDLYHRRPRGSVRAYFSHLVRHGEEVYQRPGRQDITADVNFTDLARWHRECGWDVDPLSTQAEFIRRFRPEKRHHASKATPDDPALAIVLMEPGAGDAFKTLTARVPILHAPARNN